MTYGVASSSYLAIKCVRRLAEEAKELYPNATQVILDDMYVDDIMTGARNIQEAVILQKQLDVLLQSGGFEIHKWRSNRIDSLSHVPSERREGFSKLSIDDSDTVKTLGLEWNPNNDKFQFSIEKIESANTKR